MNNTRIERKKALPVSRGLQTAELNECGRSLPPGSHPQHSEACPTPERLKKSF